MDKPRELTDAELEKLPDNTMLAISMNDLDAYVESRLKEMDFATLCSDAIVSLQTEVRTQEKKAREINKIISDVTEQLDQMEDVMQTDERTAKRMALEKLDTSTDITLEGDIEHEDEDDDVQFIEAIKPPLNSGTIAGTNQLIQFPNQIMLGNQGQMWRPIMTSAGKPLNTAPLIKQVDNRQNIPRAKPNILTHVTSKKVDLAVGMKLYGKKNNDIWYKGSLVDIQNKENPDSNKWMYKLKFDTKGIKVLSDKHIAYAECPTETLPVGSRIIALYRDEDTNPTTSYFAGVVAEPPSVRNQHRYLTFFDDGYAQYSPHREIHKVYEQSKNVWEDIDPDSQGFIQSYLQQYPERPMVRLQKGQQIKTEWQGKWWIARVEIVDASLVKMFFEADKRVEWIYRGSTRLEPLYTELANAEMVKAGKQRRHKTNLKSANKPIVEYTRGVDDRDQEPAKADYNPSSDHTEVPGKRRVARKSTANKQQNNSQSMSANSGEIRERMIWDYKGTGVTDKKNKYQASSISSMQNPADMASILQKRLLSTGDDDDSDSMGHCVDINQENFSDLNRKQYVPHKCSSKCIADLNDDPMKYKGTNPLLIPMMYKWERQIGKQKNACKKIVFYRTPCARRLRYIEEVDKYLVLTGSRLTIDLFSFDVSLHTHTEYVPIKTYCDIKDLSYGKENVPISCVNGIDRQYPDYVEYSNQRLPAKGVKLNLDEEFLVGCDCTDGCRDSSKCSCQQLTLEASRVSPGARENPDAGYRQRRLDEQVITGIYECNSKCKCNSQCVNRVVQNGLQLRLQVFKTENRGWGLRCLDDIPAGGFVCIYAGQLLTEQTANEDGKQYGDEYFAELDYIEVVERAKEGYESNADEDEGIEDDQDDDDSFDATGAKDSDSDYSGGHVSGRSRKKAVKLTNQSSQKPADQVAAWVEHVGSEAIVISDDEESNPENSSTSATSAPVVDIPKPDTPKPATAAPADTEDPPSLLITEATSLNIDGLELDEENQNGENGPERVSGSSKRTTRSQSTRFSRLPDPQQSSQGEEKKEADDKEDDFESSRKYFGEEFCYIMDAKLMGNLGRYLNHCCTPNCFVQNIFVDTHDLRFPWVAFFATRYIRAGTELTWDYNYEVGSVKEKILYCYCGSADCRGRLL